MLGEPPIYYLSPHSDDVAFSCTGGVACDVASGRKVTLVTVFLSGRHADQRRREDEKAAALLKCDYLCLDLPDAVDRPEIRSSLDIFMPFGQQHLGITNEVMTRLLSHIKAPAEVRAPLAVGGHIDHRVTHEAARALAYHLGPSLKLSYYEDIPYSLLPYSLGRRLDMLDPKSMATSRPAGTERALISVEKTACRDAFLTWPMARRWLPIWRTLCGYLVARGMLRADTANRRPGFPPQLQPLLRPLDAAVSSMREQTIAAYATQWPDFAESVEAFNRAVIAYTQRVGTAEAPCERLWIDDGVYAPLPRQFTKVAISET